MIGECIWTCFVSCCLFFRLCVTQALCRNPWWPARVSTPCRAPSSMPAAATFSTTTAAVKPQQLGHDPWWYKSIIYLQNLSDFFFSRASKSCSLLSFTSSVEKIIECTRVNHVQGISIHTIAWKKTRTRLLFFLFLLVDACASRT